MAQNTKIEWTQKSWNPLGAIEKNTDHEGDAKDRRPGWFCTHVAEGCRNCYAESINKRLGNGLDYTAQNRRLVQWVLKDLDAPLKWKEPQKVFTASMTDLFHEDVPWAWIDRIYAVMAITPQHVYQNLTKRSARRQSYLSIGGRYEMVRNCVQHELRNIQYLTPAMRRIAEEGFDWPLKNVWEGTSVAHEADLGQVDALLATPAALRWVSYEPAIGPVDWSGYLSPLMNFDAASALTQQYLDWIVVGGESGPQARPFAVQWARDTIRACREAGVPCFVKQLGSHPTVIESYAPHYQRVTLRLNLTDRKGGNWEEWAHDLKVREYPKEDA